MQLNSRTTLSFATSFCILVFVFVVVLNSCKKNDAIIDTGVSTGTVNTIQFFNLPANVSSAVIRVAKELEKQNEKTGFITQLANTAGYPVWAKSTIKLIKEQSAANSNSFLGGNQGSDTCVLIPMVLEDGNYVNAFIAATIKDDSVTMRLFYKNDYKAYPFKATQPAAGITTAEEFASQMMLFDKEVFDYTVFQVNDKRLFHNGINYRDTTGAKVEIQINESHPTGGGNNLIYCNETEYFVNYCTTPNAGECTGGCDNCGYPVCWTIIWSQEICTGGPGNGGGGGWPSAPPTGGGGSGGGGGAGNPPPSGCQVGGLVENGFAPPNPCYPGGGNPLPPVPPPPPHNPCDSLAKYATAPKMLAFIDTLKNQVSTRRENLYIFNDITNANAPYTKVIGEENQFEVYPATENPFVGSYGWIHNHFADLDSAGLIFSAGDLNLLADQVIRDTTFFQVNWKRFMIGVVADSGAKYMLMVEDLAKFRTWATGLYSNEFMVAVLYNATKLSQKSLPISKAETERRFLNIVIPAGLKLFRGNASGTTWTPIKLSNTGTVIENPCL